MFLVEPHLQIGIEPLQIRRCVMSKAESGARIVNN
jgi:hypothetical protein